MDMKLVAADLLVVCINKEQPQDKNRYVANTLPVTRVSNRYAEVQVLT